VPWTVLVELSDNEGEAHARAQFEGLLTDALEAGTISDAAVAESVAQSHTMWHLRESIPLAQAAEGLNIKHDIALPVSRIPAFCASAGGCGKPRARRASSASVIWASNNLHYNLQAPEGARGEFLAAHETAINAWSTTRCSGSAARSRRARHRAAQARTGAARRGGGAGVSHQVGARPSRR
jgi:FAD/FMN-containing dehydrogenase